MVRRILTVTGIIGAITGMVLVCYIAILGMFEYRTDTAKLRADHMRNNYERLQQYVDTQYRSIIFDTRNAEKELQRSLNDELNHYYTLLDTIYKKTPSDKRDLVIERFIKTVRKTDPRLYAVTYEGVALIFPENRDLEGKSIVDRRDDNGKAVIREELDAVKSEKQACVESSWNRNNGSSLSPEKRLSCLVRFDALDFYLGLGDWVTLNKPVSLRQIGERVGYAGEVLGYRFVLIDYEGNAVYHFDKGLKGKNISDERDASGKYITQEILKARNSNEGLVLNSERIDVTKERRKTILYCRDIPEIGAVLAAEADVIIEGDEYMQERSSLYSRATFRFISVLFIVTALILIGASLLHSMCRHYLLNTKRLIENFSRPLSKIEKADPKDFSLKEQRVCVDAFNRAIDEISNMTKKLIEASPVDSVTGLLNKRSMTDHLANELHLFKEFKNPFSLVYLDVDDFIQFTADLNKEQSQQLLCKIAEVITVELRRVDLASRWHGDEFLIILPRSSRLQAKLVSERIRKAVETICQVTVSAGVVSCRTGDTIDELMERSRRALEKAKSEGKNSTVMI
ncbi:MAG: cache domain-containing protein [Spirochaetes bacterium]|jgi:diguanylate cyclase (GGDEF)-like protein|nr:cache domain-containing protein [Spirochaetota bacterium]